MTTPAPLYLLSTNSDLTEGRGWTDPVAFYDNLTAAFESWSRAGVQGTASGAEVRHVTVDGEPDAQRNLLAASPVVIGYNRGALGWGYGATPAVKVEPWPEGKKARFRELRTRFPQTPLPAAGPTLASTLPVPVAGHLTDVFLLTEHTIGNVGDFSYDRLNPLSAHSTLDGAVAAAAAFRAQIPFSKPNRRSNSHGAHGLMYILGTVVGKTISALVPDRAAGAVWVEPEHADPEAAAAQAEYGALLAELAAPPAAGA